MRSYGIEVNVKKAIKVFFSKSKVIDVLTEGEVKDSDEARPDITIFFSGNPQSEEHKADVVVVELKRLGIPAESRKAQYISDLRWFIPIYKKPIA